MQDVRRSPLETPKNGFLSCHVVFRVFSTLQVRIKMHQVHTRMQNDNLSGLHPEIVRYR